MARTPIASFFHIKPSSGASRTFLIWAPVDPCLKKELSRGTWAGKLSFYTSTDVRSARFQGRPWDKNLPDVPWTFAESVCFKYFEVSKFKVSSLHDTSLRGGKIVFVGENRDPQEFRKLKQCPWRAQFGGFDNRAKARTYAHNPVNKLKHIYTCLYLSCKTITYMRTSLFHIFCSYQVSNSKTIVKQNIDLWIITLKIRTGLRLFFIANFSLLQVVN